MPVFYISTNLIMTMPSYFRDQKEKPLEQLYNHCHIPIWYAEPFLKPQVCINWLLRPPHSIDRGSIVITLSFPPLYLYHMIISPWPIIWKFRYWREEVPFQIVWFWRGYLMLPFEMMYCLTYWGILHYCTFCYCYSQATEIHETILLEIGADVFPHVHFISIQLLSGLTPLPLQSTASDNFHFFGQVAVTNLCRLIYDLNGIFIQTHYPLSSI